MIGQICLIALFTGNILIFHADKPGCGFSPSLSQTCGSLECNAPAAFIASRNYPLLYDSGLDCVWNIRTSDGTYIEVIFTDFNVSSPTTLCREDYLEFISGDTNTRLCNANIEQHERRFKSNRNDLTIQFRTNFDLDAGRFYASYEERRFSAANNSEGKISTW